MLGELWGELLGEFLAARRAAADGIGARVPLCGGEGRARESLRRLRKSGDTLGEIITGE